MSNKNIHPVSRARRRFTLRILGGGSEPDPRFTLANERTFLAWIRTSLALLAGGVAVDAFMGEFFGSELRKGVSVLLLLFALCVGAGSFCRWIQVERAIRQKAPLAFPWIAPLLAYGAALVAIMMAVFVIARP